MEFNNFFLNERSYKDCLKHGFTFNNLSKKELKNCLIFSDKFLDNFKISDIKIKESNVYYNIGPELHYGTLPYRSNEVRNKALVVRGPNEKKSKHVFGEGGIYDVDEYQYPIPGGVTIDDVLMGDTGLPFQLPWNEIYEGGAGGEWLYSRYNIAQDDASLNLYDLNTNFYGPYSSTGTIIDYEKYIKPVDE